MSAHNVPASGGHEQRLIADLERERDTWREAAELAAQRLAWLERRMTRMMENCGWCQETRSPSGSFSPCPLHEGAERGAIGKDKITGRLWFYCPNCGQETGAHNDGQVAPEGPHTSP